jgi:predicted heme/steroid binding protein
MKSAKTVLLAALLALGLACGYSSKATTPATAGTTPTIAALVPDNTNSGGPAFVLTVNGTNFNSNAAINWNGTAQTTTHVSGSQLTATIPATAIATSGTTAMVTVTNPGTPGGIYGGGTMAETSNSMTFTIN